MPIPELDANSRHNQPPKPGAEPSEICNFQGQVAFDAPGVELGHHGAECSFDAILKK